MGLFEHNGVIASFSQQLLCQQKMDASRPRLGWLADVTKSLGYAGTRDVGVGYVRTEEERKRKTMSERWDLLHSLGTSR